MSVWHFNRLVLVLAIVMRPHTVLAVESGCAALEKGPIGINLLVGTPGCFHGLLQIEGVVAKVLPGKKSLVLVDMAEKDDCDDDTCPIRRLPVSWDGAMPERKSRVEAQGKVEKRGGKLVFVAASIKPMPAGKTK